MGLTGRGVLVLSVLVSVLSVLGTLWVWPRLAVRSWPAMFGRLGTLLVTQIALLCTLALLANNYFVFYSSWSDLLGHSKGAVTVAGARPPVGVQVLGTEDVHAPGALGRDPAQVGRLEQVRIPGAISGLSSDGYVYLPPQYFRPEFKNTHFPVVLAMTGFPGEAKNLVTKLKYPATGLGLIRDGRMQPTVQVLMRPSPVLPRDAECEDVPGGPQSMTYFTKDVPRDLQASYRVLGEGRGWGVIGDSTGGYCALKLAMVNPGVYGSAVSLAGYFKAAEDLSTGDLFGGSQQRRNEADLNWRLAHLPQPPVAVLLANSKEDGSSYAESKVFAAAVHAPMTVAEATVDTGGHNFTTWLRLLPPALEWLGSHLQNPS